MKNIFASVLFAAAVAGSGAASAMPLAPLSAADHAGVTQVAQGCGPGFARGPRGGCRPMGRRGPALVIPGVAVIRGPRVCPPGLAFRYGRCRPF